MGRSQRRRGVVACYRGPGREETVPRQAPAGKGVRSVMNGSSRRPPEQTHCFQSLLGVLGVIAPSALSAWSPIPCLLRRLPWHSVRALLGSCVCPARLVFRHVLPERPSGHLHPVEHRCTNTGFLLRARHPPCPPGSGRRAVPGQCRLSPHGAQSTGT